MLVPMPFESISQERLVSVDVMPERGNGVEVSVDDIGGAAKEAAIREQIPIGDDVKGDLEARRDAVHRMVNRGKRGKAVVGSADAAMETGLETRLGHEKFKRQG